MANAGIFETVLNTNKQYVDAVKAGATAEIQENLLTQCRIIFKTMVLDAGLATEYKEYCENRR